MIKSKLSCRKVNLCSVAGDKLDRRLLHISPVIEKRLSTATEPADIPRNKAASSCNVGKLLPSSLSLDLITVTIVPMHNNTQHCT